MGLEYRHFVTPRASTWDPHADIAFDLDRSLRRMGLARSEAVVYDPLVRQKGLPKKRGKLGRRVDLGGEILVRWEPTEETALTAGFLFGDEDYDEGLFCEISYQSGPAYKLEQSIDGSFFELEDGERERAREGYDLRCSYVFDPPPPRLRLPDTITSPVDGTIIARDAQRSTGMYRARLLFDFSKTIPGFTRLGALPVLPSLVMAELERAFAVPLVQAGTWV